jgi:lactoylglutathione lyase
MDPGYLLGNCSSEQKSCQFGAPGCRAAYWLLVERSVMPREVFFEAVGPIGETDVNALAVKEIGPAVGYYTQCLGFTLVSRDRTTAVLRRDNVQIGLAVNGRDPEQTSCWFSVGDVDTLWREYEEKGIGPGIIGEQEYDGNSYRVFFAKEPYGVCFCFTQPI